VSAVRYFVLDANGEAVEAVAAGQAGWREWAQREAYTEPNPRIVAQDCVPGEDVVVSTVFLMFDHSFGEDAEPVLWETMIFGGEKDGYQVRYTSRAEAVAGHATALALVGGGKQLMLEDKRDD